MALLTRIIRGKTYNRMTKAVVARHVGNIRKLDAAGQLKMCGVFKGYPGVAGMVILRAESYEAAEALCKQEPLVMAGFAKAGSCAGSDETVTAVHVTTHRYWRGIPALFQQQDPRRMAGVLRLAMLCTVRRRQQAGRPAGASHDRAAAAAGRGPKLANILKMYLPTVELWCRIIGYMQNVHFT